LKIRCLNEITDYEKTLAEQYKQKEQEPDKISQVPKKFITKKTKNISLRYITMDKTVTIEKEDDIDEFIRLLKTRLLKELGEKEDVVINLLM